MVTARVASRDTQHVILQWRCDVTRHHLIAIIKWSISHDVASIDNKEIKKHENSTNVSLTRSYPLFLRKSITIRWVITITRKYSSVSIFLERAQKNKNLVQSQSLATEFSQTSRLACMKIHMVSPFETILIKIWPQDKKLCLFLWKFPVNIRKPFWRPTCTEEV